MNTDEIIRMAQECQLIGMRPHLDGIYQQSLVRFAALVADAEREAWQFNVQMAVLNERKECAKLCEKNADDETQGEWNSACFDCADRIRARGNLIVLTPSKGE
jgi:hypothetical protein